MPAAPRVAPSATPPAISYRLVAGLVLLLGFGSALASAQSAPKDAKAQATYAKALDALHHHHQSDALDLFKKANKEDGNRCWACEEQIYGVLLSFGDNKGAAGAAQQMVASAASAEESGQAHYFIGTAHLHEGFKNHKDKDFSAAEDEMKAALAADPKFVAAHFGEGMALAGLKQDDAAREQFGEYLKLSPASGQDRRRAARYLEHPELGRARMAPPFTTRTLDGREISLDDFTGKVVLIDFWATWCGPCRTALPHMQRIATRFAGEPLVILSISIDTDEAKWKEYVQQKNMTWLQARDAEGFPGKLPTLFGVHAIPSTFTIDSDGVLQDEHVGDGNIEGKLKKLLAKASETAEAPGAVAAAGAPVPAATAVAGPLR